VPGRVPKEAHLQDSASLFSVLQSRLQSRSTLELLSVRVGKPQKSPIYDDG
jgi:hypothetical protein